jgi:hypothetical protein
MVVFLDHLAELYFFVDQIVAPNNGMTSPPTLHPGCASSLRAPHRERQLSVVCYLFL